MRSSARLVGRYVFKEMIARHGHALALIEAVRFLSLNSRIQVQLQTAFLRSKFFEPRKQLAVVTVVRMCGS